MRGRDQAHIGHKAVGADPRGDLHLSLSPCFAKSRWVDRGRSPQLARKPDVRRNTPAVDEVLFELIEQRRRATHSQHARQATPALRRTAENRWRLRTGVGTNDL